MFTVFPGSPFSIFSSYVADRYEEIDTGYHRNAKHNQVMFWEEYEVLFSRQYQNLIGWKCLAGLPMKCFSYQHNILDTSDLTQKSILYFSPDPTEGLVRFVRAFETGYLWEQYYYIIWHAFTYIAYKGDCTAWEKRKKNWGARIHWCSPEGSARNHDNFLRGIRIRMLRYESSTSRSSNSITQYVMTAPLTHIPLN